MSLTIKKWFIWLPLLVQLIIIVIFIFIVGFIKMFISNKLADNLMK